MIFQLNYIIYVIYSFLILLGLYFCLLIYKKISFMIFKSFDKEIITDKKNYSKTSKSSKKNQKYHTSLISNTPTKIKKIKNQYKIKSTEKTYEDIKFVSSKPNYINCINKNVSNTNDLCGLETNEEFKKIKNYVNDNITKNITQIYLKTKEDFYKIFINSENNTHIIKNLDDFETFHKNSLISNNNINSNINSNIYICLFNSTKHMYIFVNQNKMIKIIHNQEYDDISDMIEKNNGSFMLEDVNGNNIIGYGSYSQSDINPYQIKKIFFSNSPNYETNKNYKLLCEFNYIKIYFYVCNNI